MTAASTEDLAWVRPGREKSGTVVEPGVPIKDTLSRLGRDPATLIPNFDTCALLFDDHLYVHWFARAVLEGIR